MIYDDNRYRFSEVEDDCEFVPYFDEEQVQRRLDEVPQDVVPASPCNPWVPR